MVCRPFLVNCASIFLKPQNLLELDMDLIAAAARGDVETVTGLLEEGADVHTSKTGGVTPLIAAACQNQNEVAKPIFRTFPIE